MTELASVDGGGMEYEAPVVSSDLNGIVGYAFEASGVGGATTLEAEDPVVHSAYELIGLLGSVFLLVAPPAPQQMRVLTYDALNHGCVEIRGARALSVLPRSILEHARAIDVRLQLVRTSDGCSVLFAVSTAPSMARRAA